MQVKSSKAKGTIAGWISSSFGDSFGDFDNPSGSQRSTKKLCDVNPQPAKTATTKGFFTSDSSQLWVDKYSPQNKDELAVHKKKISEVESWLLSKLNSPSGKVGAGIALLTGPPGVGKTATVQALARELQLDLHEWSNPTANTSTSSKDWKEKDSLTYTGI